MWLIIITVVLIGHWLGDFVLQENNLKASRDKKIINKAKKLLNYLWSHTLIYTSVLTLFIGTLMLFKIFVVYNFLYLILFFVITYITHIITDFCVTMINSNYLTKNGRHKYFVSIGLDQSIHYFTLFATIFFLFT